MANPVAKAQPIPPCLIARGIAKNKFKIVDDCYLVTKDITFPSPTKAAGFVTGASTNGRLAWKPVGKSEPIVQLRKKNKTEDSDSQTQNQ